jgi:alpha-1,6-mannosyltransferase
MAALGRAARLRAETRHGWTPVFERLTEIYGRLSGSRGFLGEAAVATASH